MTLVVTNTTNLELALQPDSSFWQESSRTTSASSTDPVGAWDDQSGNANHATQGTTARKPTLGTDVVTFDGGDGLESTAIGALASAQASWTMYLVVDLSTIDTNDRLIQFTNSTHYLEVNFSASDTLGVKLIGSSTNSAGGSSLTEGQKYLITLKSDGSNVRLYLDGTLDITVAFPTTGPTLTTLYLMNSRFYSQGVEGDLIAAYFYSTAHSDSDRGDIEDEIADEYIHQTASPNAIAVTATVQQPTVSVASSNQTANPDAIAITATVEQPTVIGPNQTASPNAIAVTATVEQPTVTPGAVTANPDSITITATVEQPSVTTGAVSVSPDAIAVTATVEQPTVIGPNQTASPDAIAITATVQQPTVTVASGNQTANPDSIAITATVEQPTVSTGAVSVSPDAISVTATVEQPTITTGAVTANPDLITITATVEQPTVTDGSTTATYSAVAAWEDTYTKTPAWEDTYTKSSAWEDTYSAEGSWET